MGNNTNFEPSKITSLVISSLKNVLLENESSDAENVNGETSLLGHRAVLDSLGLVTLLVDLEQRMDEDYDVSITLADERAMSQKSSPFRTVRSLTDYICLLLEESFQSVGT